MRAINFLVSTYVNIFFQFKGEFNNEYTNETSYPRFKFLFKLILYYDIRDLERQIMANDLTTLKVINHVLLPILYFYFHIKF